MLQNETQSASVQLLSDYLSKMFYLRTQIHYWHFQVPKLVVHKGLNDLYDDILEFADSFTETAQGIYGVRVQIMPSMQYQDFVNMEQIFGILQEYMIYITELQSQIQESELINMLDEQKSAFGKHSYLLSLE